MNKWLIPALILGGLFYARKSGANIPGFSLPSFGGLNMKLSQSGADFIQRHEGLRVEAYKDVGGLWTIGYGHLLPQDKDWSGHRITIEEAKQMFAFDVKEAEDAVNRLVKVPLTQNQFDALVSWTFNLGAGNLEKSTMLQVLNSGNYEEVPNQIKRWVYVGGELSNGLVNRRQDEANLFVA